MKLDKRVVIGSLVVIGGIFLLWLLNKMGSASAVAGDALPDQSQPAPGGDSTIAPLPDVGDISPRFQTAPPAARVTGGGCCNDDEQDCGGMGSYIQSVAPVMLPESYLEAAYSSLQSAVVSYPMRSSA